MAGAAVRAGLGAVTAFLLAAGVLTVTVPTLLHPSCVAADVARQQRNLDGPVTIGPGPKVAVLGDSYSEGSWLDDPRGQAWPALAGQAAGWSTWVDGVGGSGLLAGGPCGDQQFSTRAAAIAALDPDLLIVQVGLNDAPRGDPSGEQAAIEALLNQLHRDAPGAEVVVIGPPAAPKRMPGAAGVDAALAAATDDSTYVSTLDWSLPFRDDQVHLTAEGHAQFATGVLSALR